MSEQYAKDLSDWTLPPHIYAVAKQVYQGMLREETLQCCIISGESGAGKTETCKLLVQQLLFLSESEMVELNVKIEQVGQVCACACIAPHYNIYYLLIFLIYLSLIL